MNSPLRVRRARFRVGSFGFTLVELLVVIGIIAVLISILLPVLGSVKRQAAAVKCGAALREIGNAFQMYGMENKGYYPPMRCISNYKIVFNSSPPVLYDVNQTYWMYFLAKYVSKGKFGNFTGVTAQDAAYSMRSVLWGCPAFQPIISSSATTSVGGFAVVYTGYGMNGFPEYTPTYPPPNVDQYNTLGDSLSPSLDTRAVSSVNCTPAQNWSNITAGRWYKQKAYSTPAERALVGDCRAYVLEAMSAPNIGGIAGQADLNSPATTFWVGAPDPGQTSYDFYRHGTYPKRKDTQSFSPNGGKVAFNVLLADGHVQTFIHREDGFKAARMRWPN